MPEYEVDPKEVDSIGLTNQLDTSGRRLEDLTVEENAYYVKHLKRHLYSSHGCDTSKIDLHPLTAVDLEAAHYAMHREGFFKRHHFHSSMTYPDVNEVSYSDSPSHESAWHAIVEARGEREE